MKSFSSLLSCCQTHQNSYFSIVYNFFSRVSPLIPLPSLSNYLLVSWNKSRKLFSSEHEKTIRVCPLWCCLYICLNDTEAKHSKTWGYWRVFPGVIFKAPKLIKMRRNWSRRLVAKIKEAIFGILWLVNVSLLTLVLVDRLNDCDYSFTIMLSYDNASD